MNGFYDQFRHGSALWAPDHICKQAELIGGNSVYIGQSPERGLDMTLGGDCPLTLIGGAGCGKTASLIMYSARYPGSMFLLDPRGEIASVTADYHRKQGKEVYFINPAGLLGLENHSLNLLDLLDSKSPTLGEDIQIVMEALVPIRNSASDDFFEATTRQRAGMILRDMVLRYDHVTLLDLKQVLSWLRGHWEVFLKYAQEQLLTSPDQDIKIAAREIIEERESAPKQFQGFIGTLAKSFGWLSGSGMQNTVSGSDFSMSVLSEKKPAVVFLIVPPEYMELWQPFLRLCVTIPVLYKQRRPNAAPVLYMLDELATLGRFEMAERLYSFARGGGNRVFGVFQSIGQINKLYGPAGAQIFLSSSQARLFKGCRDLETAHIISGMLGNQTLDVENSRYQAQARHARQQAVTSMLFGGADPFQAGMELSHWNQEQHHREKIQRPLLTPSEVLALPEDRMIAFIAQKNCPPILARTTPYYLRRDLKGVFKPNPYYS